MYDHVGFLPEGAVRLGSVAGLRQQPGKEVTETFGDVHDRSTDAFEDGGGRLRTVGDEENQKRHASPGQDLLDHCSPPVWEEYKLETNYSRYTIAE